jgi:hypothetical protein
MTVQTDRPWTYANKGSHSVYYSSAYGRQNGNVIFAPGIDRFILADNYDIWTVFETAKLLSSKIPTQVYVLGKHSGPNDTFTCGTCINYTFSDKSGLKVMGSSIITARQTPLISKISEVDALVNEGFPPDYDNEQGRAMIERLQDYARFTLRALYAIKFADACNNIKPMAEMFDYFDPQLGKVISNSPDHTYSEYGMVRTVKTILYHADTVEEALANIELAMRDAPDQPLFRNKFYEILGIPVPDSVKNLQWSGKASPWAIA